MSHNNESSAEADASRHELPSRFHFIDIIGQGSIGVVYKAWDALVGQTVAVKVLPLYPEHSREFLQQIRREVTLARKVSHPNVVRIFDLWVGPTSCSISMEYVEGQSLLDLLARSRSLKGREFMEIAMDLCAAVAACHRAGVVHCDIKPSNILVTPSRTVLTDLGFAVPVRSYSTTAMGVGARLYTSPEQRSGSRIDYRSDIYSLGLVLFEMITGFRYGHKISADLRPHVNAVPVCDTLDLDPRLPEWISGVLERCLESDRERRFQHVSELADELAKHCEELNLETPASEQLPRQSEATQFARSRPVSHSFSTDQLDPALNFRRRRTTLLALAAFLAILAGATATIIAIGVPDQRRTPARIAFLPLHIQGDASPDETLVLQGFQRNLYNRISTAIRPARLWRLEGFREPRDMSNILNRSDLVLSGSLFTRNTRAVAQVNILSPASNKRIASFNITGSTRDLLQFEADLFNIMLKQRSVRALVGQMRETKQITGDTDAYRFFCKADSIMRRATTTAELEGALAQIEQALLHDTGFATAYACAAAINLKLYQMSHDRRVLADAWHTIDTAYRLDRYLPTTLVLRSYVYQSAEKPREALRLLDEPAIADDEAAQKLRGFMLFRQGAQTAAIDVLRKCAESNPLAASTHILLGECYRESGDYKSAIRAYRAAVDIDDSDHSALLTLGELYIRAGRPERSIAYLQRAVESRPDAISYASLAIAHLLSHKKALAAPLFEKAVELDQASDVYVGYLGEAYRALGRYHAAKIKFSEARRLVRKYLQREPLDAGAIGRLASYDAELGDLGKAQAEIAVAVEASPSDLDIRYRLAVIQASAGHYVSAGKTLGPLCRTGYALPCIPDNPDRKVLLNVPGFTEMCDKYAEEGTPLTESR